MGMLGRMLATAAAVLALGACGSRTPLRLDDDESLEEFAQAGAGGAASGEGGHSGDRGGAGSGSGGRDGSGAGGHGGQNSAGDGGAGMAAGSPPGGQGGTGAGGAGTGAGIGGAGFGAGGFGGAGFGGFPAGQGGLGGFPGGAGEGGVSGMAGEILNPHGCATPEPFVVSIDPMGTSGNVRGWLESAAGMVFEEQLPRFVRAFGPDRPVSAQAIALWWSIGSLSNDGQGQLYFYAGDFTNSTTEIAVAHGASRFTDIDIDALELTMETISAKTGSFVVFRNILTGEVLAMRLDEIFATDIGGDSLCAAVDASWRFLR
jgi:hypothetical protein